MFKIYKLYPTFPLFLRFVGIILLTLAILGIAAAIISMFFGKPIGDDYGAIESYQPNVWLETAQNSLKSTGRYGQSVASSVFYASMGESITVILPLVTIAWLVTVCYLYIASYTKIIDKTGLSALAFTLILCFSILFVNDAHPAIDPTTWISYQTFFWPSGIITYTIPLLIFLTGIYFIYLSKIAVHISSFKKMIYLTTVTFFTSLFNEAQPATIFAISILMILLSYISIYRELKRYRRACVVTASSTFAGLITLFFSPGSIKRRQNIVESSTSSGDGSLVEGVVRNLHTVADYLYLRPSEIILLMFIGALAAATIWFTYRDKNTPPNCTLEYICYLKYSLFIITLFLGSLITSLTLTSIGYGYFSGVLARTLLIPQILYVIMMIFIAYGATLLLLQRYKINIFIKIFFIILCCAFIFQLPTYISKIRVQVDSSVTYYNAWLEQDELLRKYSDIKTDEPLYIDEEAAGLGDGYSLSCTGPYAHTTIWLNKQIAEYYDSPDVCSKEDLPDHDHQEAIQYQ